VTETLETVQITLVCNKLTMDRNLRPVGPNCGDCGADMRLWVLIQEHYELTPEELLDVRIRWNLIQDQGIQDQNGVWTLEI